METNMTFDIDTLNLINREDRHERQEVNERKNKILRMVNPQRRQKEWDKLYPKLELDGLTPDQLEEINNTVY